MPGPADRRAGRGEDGAGALGERSARQPGGDVVGPADLSGFGPLAAWEWGGRYRRVGLMTRVGHALSTAGEIPSSARTSRPVRLPPGAADSTPTEIARRPGGAAPSAPRFPRACLRKWTSVDRVRSSRSRHSCTSSKARKPCTMAGSGRAGVSGVRIGMIWRTRRGREEAPGGRRGVGVRAMIVERIKSMLEACEAGTAAFPPAELYNEDWLLRIILDWFARHGGDRYPLSPRPGARWFSQAWLPSAFLSRYRGDRLAEARTHADGVLGHFAIGDPGTAALSLVARCPSARRRRGQAVRPAVGRGPQRTLLRPGGAERRVHGRDPPSRRQATPRRWRSSRSSSSRRRPGSTTGSSSGTWPRTPSAARSAAASRTTPASATTGSAHWFEPTWKRLEVRSLSWEDLIDAIAFHSQEDGHVIDSFYGQCLRFNRPQGGRALPRAPLPVRPRAEVASPPAPEIAAPMPEWSAVS